MTSINHYRIFCTTEDTFVYSWDSKTPTHCPNNINHTIDAETISHVNSIKESNVTINQYSDNVGGSYKCESYTINAVANTTSNLILSWPINIACMTVNFTTTSIETGNEINSYIAPNETIGVTTSNITSGNTVINVSNTVFDHIKIGYYINITNGSVNLKCGRCTEINKTEGTIKVETAATENIGSGSYVQITVHNVHFLIGNANHNMLATKHLGSSYLPANVPVKVTYTNNSNEDLVFYFYIEIYY